MRLPFAERAEVELAKLRDYCLNPSHEEGRHKARVFAGALGLGQDDAQWLQREILAAVRAHEAREQSASPYGKRYVVDFLLTHGGKQALVRTAWIIRTSDDRPRLTSCYVL